MVNTYTFHNFSPIVRKNVPFTEFTSFKLGGNAEYFSSPETIEELRHIVLRCIDSQIPYHVLGGGTNILVADGGVRGMVIHLASSVFKQASVQGCRIVCSAGISLAHLIGVAVNSGLAGLESLSGIPGTLGGAVKGNSGGREGDIGQWVDEVTLIDKSGHLVQHSRDALLFNYRDSNLADDVIIEVVLELSLEEPAVLKERAQKILISKKRSQPLVAASGGCAFKNPRGISAGSLIAQAGLAGFKIGRAEISRVHQNFIVAHPGATSADVMKLIDRVRSRVEQEMHVRLELELQVWS